MKKAKLRKFAAWLREQPNKITTPGECGIPGTSTPAFNWADSWNCVATYAKRWAFTDGKDIGHSAGPEVLADVFNMPRPVANALYTWGGLIVRDRSYKKVMNAKLNKVADVVEYVADGGTVIDAMYAVFGERSFKHHA